MPRPKGCRWRKTSSANRCTPSMKRVVRQLAVDEAKRRRGDRDKFGSRPLRPSADEAGGIGGSRESGLSAKTGSTSGRRRRSPPYPRTVNWRSGRKLTAIPATPSRSATSSAAAWIDSGQPGSSCRRFPRGRSADLFMTGVLIERSAFLEAQGPALARKPSLREAVDRPRGNLRQLEPGVAGINPGGRDDVADLLGVRGLPSTSLPDRQFDGPRVRWRTPPPSRCRSCLREGRFHDFRQSRQLHPLTDVAVGDTRTCRRSPRRRWPHRLRVWRTTRLPRGGCIGSRMKFPPATSLRPWHRPRSAPRRRFWDLLPMSGKCDAGLETPSAGDHFVLPASPGTANQRGSMSPKLRMDTTILRWFSAWA